MPHAHMSLQRSGLSTMARSALSENRRTCATVTSLEVGSKWLPLSPLS